LTSPPPFENHCRWSKMNRVVSVSNCSVGRQSLDFIRWC
jgi:hypothetical protein